MPSYFKILHTAYRITLKNPLLWLFGLFVVGGFNLNFFRFSEISTQKLSQVSRLKVTFLFFQNHPAALAAASSITLIISLIGLVVTNWSRIMLVLTANSILTTKEFEGRKEIQKSKALILPIIRLSLFTTTLIVVVAAVLVFPPWFFISDPQTKTVLLTLALVIFLPLLFTISCINIFSTFFLILFKKDLWSSLNLGTDFFVAKWTQILAFAFLLIIIYSVCFIGGLAVILLIKLFFAQLPDVFRSLGNSATINLSEPISGVLIWFLLGVLNTFINTALLLLFLELITPIEKEKEVTEAVPAPVSLQ